MQHPYDVAAAVLADLARDGITEATADQLRLAVHAYTTDPATRLGAEQILMEAFLQNVPLDSETAS